MDSFKKSHYANCIHDIIQQLTQEAQDGEQKGMEFIYYLVFWVFFSWETKQICRVLKMNLSEQIFFFFGSQMFFKFQFNYIYLK